jgi:DNA-nicking Smr family endonuclease
MSTRPPRRLRDDEDSLWQDVTRSIAPLRRRQKPQADKSEAKQFAATPGARKPSLKPVAVSIPARIATAPLPALAPLGRRMKQRLARGTENIDGRLDLHGHTQAEAHVALLRFLRNAQDRGAKNVLVITGKGGRDAERGVLKRQVPLWLRLREFRSLVVGFEDAHIGHGGEGALYVRLRRAK